jgi:TonB family protein
MSSRLSQLLNPHLLLGGMTAAPHLSEIRQPAPVPRLLVELPSWPRVFFGNLRDLVFPRRLPPLELRSAPAPFWPDVFVQRRLPWGRFLQSVAYHAIALVLLIGFTSFFASQPRVVARPAFDRTQVIYYQAAEYLPPLDTRSAPASRRAKADPEFSGQAFSQQAFSRQPIISVPPEADNRSQTVVTPPKVKLRREVALPNIVAWSDKMSDNMEKPRLAIPPVPLTPAADITRIAPQMENSVVTPPPDAAHLAQLHRRNSPALQDSIIAPPPSVEGASARPLGDLNIGRSSVIAPAPQLLVREQRVLPGSRSSGLGAPQVVAPPPSVSASGSSGESFGGRGRVIALNLHPAVGAPPDPPAGNRRGAFAATPAGHPGASGSPGAVSGGPAGGTDAGGKGISKESAGGSSRRGTGEVPAGLYVGSAPPKTSPVAGDPAKAPANPGSPNSVNPNLMASVRPPRVTSAPSRPMEPGNPAKLSETERAVFGNRKFYSLTLNMPNLNSASGSWVIRFAELNHDSRDANQPAGDLSQPTATRKVDPAYPLQLMRENVTGTVILYAIIHADGTVGNVRILRGVDDRLDQFASQAVAQWQFQPAMKNGSPVDVEATFQIPFRPAKVGTNF